MELLTNISYDYEFRTEYTVPIIVTGHGRSVTHNLTVNIVDRNEPHEIDNLDTTVYISTDKLKDEQVRNDGQ